jgi:hypothetical protein
MGLRVALAEWSFATLVDRALATAHCGVFADYRMSGVATQPAGGNGPLAQCCALPSREVFSARSAFLARRDALSQN